MKYLILAGGSGSRLWPLSRKNYPKQFLALINEYSLLQNTVLRVSKQKGKDVFIVSSCDSYAIIEEQVRKVLPDFENKNLILEPVGRNTLPAIAYSTIFFEEEDIVAVLSADHYIKNEKKFNDLLFEAESIAKDSYIVTLGIVPDQPKTGYGYIKKSNKKIASAFFVERFVEKPTLDKAIEYVNDGNYFWNAGIFVFKVSLFLSELKKFEPDLFNVLEALKEKIKKGEKITYNDYIKFKNISIDYGIMEKTDKITVLPADIGWSDIGSFKSIYEIAEKDKSNSVFRIADQKRFDLESKNIFVIGNKRSIVTIDLKDILIVDTDDALLVSNLESTEKIKFAYETLLRKDEKICSLQQKEFYNWGEIEFITRDDFCLINKVKVNSNNFFYFNDPYSIYKRNITILNGESEFLFGFNEKRIVIKEKESYLLKENEKIKIRKISDELSFIEVVFLK